MNSTNARRNAALGKPHGTATSELRKLLLFDMAKRLGELDCFRCKTIIATVEEFSIEHKISWLNSPDPKLYFYDLSNIAFSHYICNTKAGRSEQADRVRKYANSKEHGRATWKREYADPIRYANHLQMKRNEIIIISVKMPF
jgi:hypothetical protein